MNYIYLIADTQNRCVKIGTGPSQSHLLHFLGVSVFRWYSGRVNRLPRRERPTAQIAAGVSRF